MAVYYLCLQASNHPTGGIRVMYRHVDILNEAGVPAYIVHRRKGFRCTWFENKTPIVYLQETIFDRLWEKVHKRIAPAPVRPIRIQGGARSQIGSNDLLVIPEIYGPSLVHLGRGIKKIILNQNCYMTFRGYNFRADSNQNAYDHPDVLGVLVNSEDGAHYLKYAFPEVRLEGFKLSIDPALFHYTEKKQKQITFSLIKNKQDALQVINILRVRGALQGWNVVPFINRPQREVAAIMKESLIFLSFGYPEGFGLPAAEAMACGCLVIGYHGGGGREFFKPEFSFPIEVGDILGFCRTVEQVLCSYDAERERYERMRKSAADFIRKTYSPEEEKRSVLAAWRQLAGLSFDATQTKEGPLPADETML